MVRYIFDKPYNILYHFIVQDLDQLLKIEKI